MSAEDIKRIFECDSDESDFSGYDEEEIERARPENFDSDDDQSDRGFDSDEDLPFFAQRRQQPAPVVFRSSGHEATCVCVFEIL